MSNLMTKLAAVTLAAAAAATAQAQDAAPTTPTAEQRAFTNCVEREGDTSAGYSICYGQAIRRAEAVLAQRVEALASGIGDPEAAAAVRREQAAWQAYRSDACSFYWTQPHFGSMHRSIVGPSCILRVVNERIAHIDWLLEGEANGA